MGAKVANVLLQSGRLLNTTRVAFNHAANGTFSLVSKQTINTFTFRPLSANGTGKEQPEKDRKHGV